jgi:hypothetical protein
MTSLSLNFTPSVKQENIFFFNQQDSINKGSSYVAFFNTLDNNISYEGKIGNVVVSGNSDSTVSYFFTPNYKPTSFIPSFPVSYCPLDLYGLPDFDMPIEIAPDYKNANGDKMQGCYLPLTAKKGQITTYNIPSVKAGSIRLTYEDNNFGDPYLDIPIDTNAYLSVYFLYPFVNSNIVKAYAYYGKVVLTYGAIFFTKISNFYSQSLTIVILGKTISLKPGEEIDVLLENKEGTDMTLTTGNISKTIPLVAGTKEIGISDSFYSLNAQGNVNINNDGSRITTIINLSNLPLTVVWTLNNNITFLPLIVNIDISSYNVPLGQPLTFYYDINTTEQQLLNNPFYRTVTSSFTW